MLLSGHPIISECMARNISVEFTKDESYPDWIELYNPTDSPVDLTGWQLRFWDSEHVGTQSWSFPAVELGAGEYLLVFAAEPTQLAPDELSCDLRIRYQPDNAELSLWDAQGSPVDALSWDRPQVANRSYGVSEAAEERKLVAAGDLGVYVVPAAPGDAPPEWTTVGFDDSSWAAGPTGLGFDAPGFAVWSYLAADALDWPDGVEALLADPAGKGLFAAAENSEVLNYRNNAGGGHYPLDSPFPGLPLGSDIDDYAVKAVGVVTIPAPGDWTFGAVADGEYRLRITRGALAFTFPADAEDEVLRTFRFTEAGEYELTLIYRDHRGTGDLELFAAQGAYDAFDEAAFRLVGDVAGGGLAVHSPLVDPVPTSGAAPGLLARTDVEPQMRGANASVYLRVPFAVADPAEIQSLTLRMSYSDGYVAYLNGVEIARRNAPDSPQWDAHATAGRSPAEALTPESIDCSDYLHLLAAGQNVLAVHALNDAPGDGQFLVLPELVETLSATLVERTFPIPTPGMPNREPSPAERYELTSGRGGAVTYTDLDGDRVTISLSGPGRGEVVRRPGSDTSVQSIRLDGTTDRSSLVIQVVKARGGDGHTAVGDIVVGGRLKALTAKTADLVGNLVVDGLIASVSLGDVLPRAVAHGIHLNADDLPVGRRDQVTIAFDRIQQADLDTHGLPIRLLSATKWFGSDDGITAPWIDKLVITGRPGTDWTAVNGLFGADLNLTGQGAAPGKVLLGTAYVDHDVSGNWDIQGAVGLIVCDGTADSFDFVAAGPVRGIAAEDYLMGNLQAQWFGTIYCRGFGLQSDVDIVATGADARNVSIGLLTASAVRNASVRVPGGIAVVCVADWQDTGNPDFIEADWLGRLVVRGGAFWEVSGEYPDGRWVTLAGDFQADVELKGELLPPGKSALGSASILGEVSESAWDIGGAGGAGAIRIGSAAATWALDAEGPVKRLDAQGDLAGELSAAQFGGISVKGELTAAIAAQGSDPRRRTSIGALTAGTVRDVSLDVPGGIGAITVVEWLDTDDTPETIRAGWIGGLTTKGRRANGRLGVPAAAGDFQVRLNLTGQSAAPRRPLLGTARIAGGVGDASWDIPGSAGAVSILGSANGWTASVGSLKSLTAGEIVQADVTVADALGSVKARRWSGGKLAADSLGSLRITGDRRTGTPGDFGADLLLGGLNVPAGKATLGSAGIAGDLLSGEWRIGGNMGMLTVSGMAENCTVRASGSIRRLTLGGTDHSSFLAGIDLETLVFDEDAVIAVIRVCGWRAAPGEVLPDLGIDSSFWAASMGKVSLMNGRDADGFQLFVLGDEPNWQIRSMSYRDTRSPGRWSWRPGQPWPGPAGTEPNPLP